MRNFLELGRPRPDFDPASPQITGVILTGMTETVKLQTMINIPFEIIAILLLILLNGILSMAEFTVIASRKARLQERAQRGNPRATAALELAKDPADFLSTVQIGITLVGVLAGAFGGAAPAKALAGFMGQIPLLAPYRDGLSVVLMVLLITFLTLVFGELVPKRLALTRPERFAEILAPPMMRFSRLASPLVSLLSGITNLVLKILGASQPVEMPASEEEIRLMIAQATKAGVFLEAEKELVSGVFRLGDRRASTLITPRTEIEWLDLEDSPDTNLAKIKESRHARFPVGKRSLDEVLGWWSLKICCAAAWKGLRRIMKRWILNRAWFRRFLFQRTPLPRQCSSFFAHRPTNGPGPRRIRGRARIVDDS